MCITKAEDSSLVLGDLMKLQSSDYHPSWALFFNDHLTLVNRALSSIADSSFTPQREDIFRAFKTPLNEIRVVIFGQDPYPGIGVADGLAFSSRGATIPASLKNIFKEYSSDLALPSPAKADLSQWSKGGVMLLNRTLTTSIGERNSHLETEWRDFTYEVANYLAKRDVIAILWGNYAKELAPLFRRTIESVHPSPLSARKGFFGSQPFSRVNAMLQESGEIGINWRLE